MNLIQFEERLVEQREQKYLMFPVVFWSSLKSTTTTRLRKKKNKKRKEKGAGGEREGERAGG